MSKEEMKVYTPLKAIRLKCLDCSNGSFVEVKYCPCENCTLWPYRLGHRPKKIGATVGVDDLADSDEEIIDEEAEDGEVPTYEGVFE